jgi:AcrR family transcriptional regulator
MTNPSLAAPPSSAPRGNARGDATRTRLLRGALESFANHGFHGTGTRDIADRAGMSPAAVYAHYRTKEDLLFALPLAGHQEALDVVETAARRPGDPARRLHGVVRDFAAWHAEHHVTARVVQYEMAALTPDHAAEVATVRRAIEDVVRVLIDEGVAAGDLHVASSRLATVAVLSLGIDVARWYRTDRDWSPAEIGEQYAILGLQLAGHQLAT